MKTLRLCHTYPVTSHDGLSWILSPFVGSSRYTLQDNPMLHVTCYKIMTNGDTL